MSDQFTNEPMLDIYIFETSQLIGQLEEAVLVSEKAGDYSSEIINEIFRVMHTIKGSSAMMLFNSISELAHIIEDLFFFLREEKPSNIDFSTLTDLVFDSIDFIKLELEKIKNKDAADGDATMISATLKAYIEQLKKSNPSTGAEGNIQQNNIKTQYYVSQSNKDIQCSKYLYRAEITFEAGCEMENIRAYTIIHNLKSKARDIWYIPSDIIENDESIYYIRSNGFTVYFKSNLNYDETYEYLAKSLFLNKLKLTELQNDEAWTEEESNRKAACNESYNSASQLNRSNNNYNNSCEVQSAGAQGFISVSVNKMDKLMDLVGEMVIAEAMVTQNPDLKGISLDSFSKAARQLRKITSELQDMVMSIRMVPLSGVFHKMHRIVRDMNKKLGKDIELEIIGEETEVDKNIIENISDPIMHLVRNAIDHGIETAEEREAAGKNGTGTVTLEAKNAGNDVIILIKDDGRGLSKKKIFEKARSNGLTTRHEKEMTDSEIYNLIFMPGFSTKDDVTEFSGRGVGMDVVLKNIEKIGGSVSVNSVEGIGTTIAIKIPLTLAIIDGMNIRVGSSRYTIPTTIIKQSFRPAAADIIKDSDGDEMIMVRGQCYPILRIHKHYNVCTNITELVDGILIMTEYEGKMLCIFADELLGQQQVVVKALPKYIKNTREITGLAGCTLLGDGSISLILNVAGLVRH